LVGVQGGVSGGLGSWVGVDLRLTME